MDKPLTIRGVGPQTVIALDGTRSPVAFVNMNSFSLIVDSFSILDTNNNITCVFADGKTYDSDVTQPVVNHVGVPTVAGPNIIRNTMHIQPWASNRHVRSVNYGSCTSTLDTDVLGMLWLEIDIQCSVTIGFAEILTGLDTCNVFVETIDGRTETHGAIEVHVSDHYQRPLSTEEIKARNEAVRLEAEKAAQAAIDALPQNVLYHMNLSTMTLSEAMNSMLAAGFDYRFSPQNEPIYDRRGLPLFVFKQDETYVVDVMGQNAVSGDVVYKADGEMCEMLKGDGSQATGPQGNLLYLDAYWGMATLTTTDFSVNDETVAAMQAADYTRHNSPDGAALFDASGSALFLTSDNLVINTQMIEQRRGVVVYGVDRQPIHKSEEGVHQYTPEGLPIYLDAYWQPVIGSIAPHMIADETMAQQLADGFVPLSSPYGQAMYDVNGSALFLDPSGAIVNSRGSVLPSREIAYDLHGAPIRAVGDDGVPKIASNGDPLFIDAYFQEITGKYIPLAELQLDGLSLDDATSLLMENGFTHRDEPSTNQKLYTRRGYPYFLGPSEEIVDVTGKKAPKGWVAYLVDGTMCAKPDDSGAPGNGTTYLDAYLQDALVPMPDFTVSDAVVETLAQAGFEPNLGYKGKALFTCEGLGLFKGPTAVLDTTGATAVAGAVVCYADGSPVHTLVEGERRDVKDVYSYSPAMLPLYKDAYWNDIEASTAPPLVRGALLEAITMAGYTADIGPHGQPLYNANGSILFLAQTGEVVDRFGVQQSRGQKVYDIYNGDVRQFDEDGTPSVDIRGNALFQDAYGQAVPNQYEGSPLPSELGVANMTMDTAESTLLSNQYSHRYSPDGHRLFDRLGRPWFIDIDDDIVDTRGETAAAGVPAYLDSGSMCPKLDPGNNLQTDDKGQVYIDAYWSAVSDPNGDWTINEESAAVMAGNGYTPHTGPQGEALFDSAGSALFMNAGTFDVMNSYGTKAAAGQIVFNAHHLPVNKVEGSDWVYNNGMPVYIDAFWADVVMTTDTPVISEARLAKLEAAGFKPVRSQSGLAMYSARGALLLVGAEGEVCISSTDVCTNSRGGVN
ncbi:hypothetical protein SARC_04718 [Sphaeroforma arctica JP610]|uniref:Uncharacterized protein n=1 Tax=Sphaeroforma arctica JP610 TaxID=667725 RepID=A0A0L0G2G4_9EUKA|nr:hypothetical protein SARC_04718 [Sphaeroforma arctica JP610]KNC83016.1 hypothetical protein SARC_04718 [Sphaeroforma arctica JP610]|eukprot:XP_014156918.1 hypothetical protein SARC_04718 [Sphaeroforma arctica JP610]